MGLLENQITHLQFRLRSRILGRLKLRPGLPAPERGAAVERERRFYALVCERALDPEARKKVAWVWDVGCRNWSYAAALADAFPRAWLRGVEVDGGRRYLNLHRRMDLAAAHALELVRAGRDARCHFRDFREVGLAEEGSAPGSARRGASGSVCFTFFFPFVSSNPCARWGLPPDRFADFGALLKHALSAEGGRSFLSTHQGEWEAELARDAYRSVGLNPFETVVKPAEFSEFWPSPHDLHILTACTVA